MGPIRTPNAWDPGASTLTFTVRDLIDLLGHPRSEALRFQCPESDIDDVQRTCVNARSRPRQPKRASLLKSLSLG